METEWSFTSYEKIPENFQKECLQEEHFRLFKKVNWVVTEKIHGANFALVTNGKEVRAAKRKEFLQEGEDFFGHQYLLKRLQTSVLELFSNLQEEEPDLDRITVYGELFGGEYPHPEVKPIEGLKPVQTGIYYSPRIEFAAFDIALEKKDPRDKRRYLDYCKAREALDLAGIFFVRPLFTGSYEKTMAYPLGFSSTVPELLGFPPLLSPNKAEGVVIKADTEVWIHREKGDFRPVVKRKIPEFSEKEDFHQSEKWVSFSHGRSHIEPVALLEYEILSLINKNRMESALSKWGNFSLKKKEEREKLKKVMIEDIWEQVERDYGEDYLRLDLEKQEHLEKFLEGKVEKFLLSSPSSPHKKG